MVWTGATRSLVLGTRTITGSAARATMRLVVPKYIYKFRKDFGQPDKNAELKKHSVRDVKALVQVARKTYVASINTRRRRRKRRI